MNEIKINQTTNYEKFNLLDANRKIKEAKVLKLLKSISNGLNLLPYSPILVDNDMFILDGQHRFEASKRSNNPVYYIIVPKMYIEDIAEMNNNSDKWTIMDFITSYAAAGKEDYIKLLQLKDRYKTMSISTLAEVFALERHGMDVSRNISDGSYKLIDASINHKIIIHYEQITDIHPKLKSTPVLRSLKLIMKKIDKYNTTRMIDKMILCKKQKDLIANHQVRDCIRLLEDTYNLFTKKDIVYFTECLKEQK